MNSFGSCMSEKAFASHQPLEEISPGCGILSSLGFVVFFFWDFRESALRHPHTIFSPALFLTRNLPSAFVLRFRWQLSFFLWLLLRCPCVTGLSNLIMNVVSLSVSNY